jgi:hypothetical protein
MVPLGAPNLIGPSLGLIIIAIGTGGKNTRFKIKYLNFEKSDFFSKRYDIVCEYFWW